MYVVSSYLAADTVCYFAHRNHLGPRYEEQLIFMAEPIPHPKRPPRTPSRRSLFFAADGRAETDSSNFELRGHYCAPF